MIENFENLLEETLKKQKSFEGTVVQGKVISMNNNEVLIDAGLKSEGRISLEELKFCDKNKKFKIGDTIAVYVERLEDKNGEPVLSREKARKEEAFDEFIKAQKSNKTVDGIIYGKVKGGYTVDINGVITFLPGSQVDIRPINDISHLLVVKQSFKILKIDKERGNIVISRKAFLESKLGKTKSYREKDFQEGKIVEGIIKNITDYGAFIDLGICDGLLHLTDISWKIIDHPSDHLKIGQKIKVKIIKFNKESKKISLGIKQLTEDPWKNIEKKYKVGKIYSGKISKITEYGAFIKLEDGIEGLIHISEMTWNKKINDPKKIVSLNQEVEVAILELDTKKRKLSFRMKLNKTNPWEEYAKKYKKGDIIKGKVGTVTEYGIFVNINENLDGMIHISDIEWEWNNKSISKFKTNDTVKSVIIEVNKEKQRISLGIKQLTDGPFKKKIKEIKLKEIITCPIIQTKADGIKVKLKNNLDGFIKKEDLSIDESEQNPKRFAPNENIDAMIKKIDNKNKIVYLSIRDIEDKEQKKIKKKFGSVDSGASLGKMLGEKTKKKKTKKKK